MFTGKLTPILLAAAAALAIAALGALTTDLSDWYEQLRKPSWQPPGWLFGPVWTTIYALAAAAAVLSWWDSDTTVERQNLLIVFFFNATLNVVWSLLFFRLRRPDWALVEVAFLWLSILVLIVVCARRDTVAPWLLAPYLAWVSFAAFLNYTIVKLNAPFGNG